MTFNEGIRTDPNRIKTSRGGGTGAAVGGIGGLIALLIFMFTGVDVSGVLGGGSTATDTAGVDISHCVSGEAANQYVECRMVATAESLDALWEEALPAQAGIEYVMPGFQIFDGSVNTACGQASSATGPLLPSRRPVRVPRRLLL